VEFSQMTCLAKSKEHHKEIMEHQAESKEHYEETKEH
jgi:hypothetical protein